MRTVIVCAMLKRSWICLLMWLLSACNTRPIENTPAIEPTLPATLTVESRPTDRVTATSASAATAAPIHPSATSRPTITPVPIPSAASSPVLLPAAILLFEVIPERANPGSTVQLRWQAQGERATLCPSSRFVLFTPDDCREVPLSGTQSFVIPSDVKGNKYIGFLLTVSGASAAPVTQQTQVAMQCQQTWSFTDEPQFGVCPLEPIRTQAAAQHFERGLMIWLKEPGRYFILENRYVAPGDIRHPLNTIADPLDVARDTANSVTPPAGLFAPTSGFGLIWRGDVQQSLGFREQLGWALEPEFGYEVTYQCDDATPSGGRVWQTCYLNGPDGRIIALLPTEAWYWRDEHSIQSAPTILAFTANRTEARPGESTVRSPHAAAPPTTSNICALSMAA